MDQQFAEFDFKNLSEDIRPRARPEPARTDAAATRPPRKPVTALSKTFYVCGPKEKTQKRHTEVQQLVTDDTKRGIVDLELIPKTEAELDQAIDAMRDAAVGLVTGRDSVQIGDNHKHRKCNLKLACTKAWSGEHGFSHTTADWLIRYLLKHVYRIKDHHADPEAAAEPETRDADVWDVDDEVEHGSYRYMPHPKQNYLVTARPLTYNKATGGRSVDREKTRNLILNVIPGFFAGTLDSGLPRIGMRELTERVRDDDKLWCKKPYCLTTLLAPTAKDSKGRPACNKFHSDESSFLTSLLRVLATYRSVSRPETTPDRPAAPTRVPGAPRKATAAVTEDTTVHVPATQNVFAALLASSAEPDDEPVEAPTTPAAAAVVDTPEHARLRELEHKLTQFISKNAEGLKYNAELRERRARIERQIETQRARIGAKRDSFDD